MVIDGIQCRHHVRGECPRSQLVLIDEHKTHYSFGCLTCKGITIVTRPKWDAYCREEGDREKFMQANKGQKSMFNIRR